MHIHKNIRLLAWFNFFADFRPYAPIAVIYFSQISHSYALGLAVFSVEMLSTSIFELPTGIISDIVGRRKAIILGAIMSVLCLLFYSIGTYYWVLIVGSIFAGLERSFYSGNNQALLHDSLKEYNQEELYAEYAGKTSSMFQFALAASALLGGIVGYFSFSLVLWISIIPQLICLAITFFISEPRVHDRNDETNIYSHLREAIAAFKKNSKLRTLSLASILEYGIGESMYHFNSAFVALLWPVWAIGIARMLSNFGAAIGMRISGYVTKRFGYFKTLIWSNIYSTICGLIATIFPSVFSPILISSTSFEYGVSSIAKEALFQKEFTDKQRATMGSLNSLGASLFFAVFAYGFGLLADRLAPNQALIIGEVLLLSVLFLYWNLFKEDKNQR